MPSKELATVEPIPPLDLMTPRLESLPSWAMGLNQMCMDLRKNDAYRIGMHGRKVVTLPASSMPSPTQRAYIERRVAELDLMQEPGPVKEIDATIGAIIVRYATARQDDGMKRARIDAYRLVLTDLPAWAVREAYARWLKGEIGRDCDPSFPPPERVLYEAAKNLTMAANGQRVGLQLVLDAEGYQPLTEAEMSERRERLKTLTQNIVNTASPEDRGPGSLRRGWESPEETARKEQILNNPGKGILAEVREQNGGDHAAA